MVYDTQLLTNVDASMTEICFSNTNENHDAFIFDDVKLKDENDNFQLTLEIYSYELSNSATNNNNNILIQSARKLVKQFADFASFKRNSSNYSAQQQSSVMKEMAMTSHENNIITSNKSNTLSVLSQASNNSYSLHKFRLIAKSVLTKRDLSDQVETRDLTLLNDYSDMITSSSDSSSSSSSATTTNQSTSVNKPPLFDYYCCRLRTAPISSDI
jgi:hypothetical protein